ncbi:uncharacterized protein NESG_02429 [Nematocida ausubeli]|uniref:Uncharacterized protein n=1 Tax=Nematocida ausubeli (strain ATCC PRA-371 / ERTm2) TaxID=1913371 RepID=A0A086IYY9_NEMA1|nr:uncharacterized protein NESG_02429 [Nematocida ausubeli]KAI5133572.1 hypothetical protein NEAUS07_0466 [Nematocida ausubeli]KAI5147176.1 hypothetical protein NEAUS05_0498 [Nematocida ausubeli]KFG25107.1 hypothetical protein NESG_02429 [Nematocida ausubeli]
MAIEKITSLKSRVKTFEGDEWGTPQHSAEILAYAGFARDLSEKSADAVICQFCGKALDGWDKEDIPWKEHKMHSSDCILFHMHKAQARMESFKWGEHRMVGPARVSAASHGLFLYNIEDNVPNMFCFNCGFNCRISGEERAHTGPRIKELHGWHNKKCSMEIAEIENRMFIEDDLDENSYFYMQLIAGKVDTAKMPVYTIGLPETAINNIELKTESGTEYMTSRRLPSRRNLSEEKKKTVPEENSSTKKKSTLKRKKSEDSQTPETEESGNNENRFTPTLNPSSENISFIQQSAETEKTHSSHRESTDLLSMSESPEVLEKVEPSLDSSASETREIIPDELVIQLNYFITSEEKAALPIKTALYQGLSKMLEEIRQITNQDIEDVRQEISQLFQ